MAELGINTVRVYTPPRRDLLDEAARHGLRVMVGLPWSQHVAFLDDRKLDAQIQRELVAHGPGARRSPGRADVRARQRDSAGDRPLARPAARRAVPAAPVPRRPKTAAPESLFTYVNFPPTEFLDLSFFDVCAFNVYLHREPDLRAYLARLQHIAGHKPLLLAEAGADSIREGRRGAGGDHRDARPGGVRGGRVRRGRVRLDRRVVARRTRRGGLGVRPRRSRSAGRSPRRRAVARGVCRRAVPDRTNSKRGRACRSSSAPTTPPTRSKTASPRSSGSPIPTTRSSSSTTARAIARARSAAQHPRVRVIDIPNGGLSAARNVGLAQATGEIVAYTDADTRVDRDWLTFLVQPFLNSDVVGSGGPNVVPADDPPMAQCIARAPGGPTHVLLDDRIAEHVPGCNMAFRRDALLAIGGFNPIYLRAGDDVDVCWRLQARGWKIGFASSALVWHHHRSIDQGVLAAAGRLRRGRALADGAPSREVPRRPHAVARPHLQPAAVRALALGRAHQRRRLGHGRLPVGLPRPTSTRSRSCRTRSGGRSCRSSSRSPAPWSPPSADHGWAAALLLGDRARSASRRHASPRTSPTRCGPTSTRCRAAGSGIARMVAYLHFIQPFARIRGQIRGRARRRRRWRCRSAARQTSRGPRPSVREALRALLLLCGSVTEDRFWSETWTSTDRVLTSAHRLAAAFARRPDDRDRRRLVGRSRRQRPRRPLGMARRARARRGARSRARRCCASARISGRRASASSPRWRFAAALLAAASAGVALRWPLAGADRGGDRARHHGVRAWRTAQATAIVLRGVQAVAERGRAWCS